MNETSARIQSACGLAAWRKVQSYKPRSQRIGPCAGAMATVSDDV